MEVNKKNVGQRIKLIRQSKGMTLEDFGKIFDASKGNVSLWEKGSSLPSNERIKMISQLGNISVNELLYGIDNKKEINMNTIVKQLSKFNEIELLELIDHITLELKQKIKKKK